MASIKTRIRVETDHRITGAAPQDVPVGEHEATITVADPSPRFFFAADLPGHDLPWNGGVSLSREDLYGDDGR